MRIDRTKLSEYGMLAWFFDVVLAQYAKEYPEEFEQVCDRQKIHRGIDLTLTVEGKEISLEPFFIRLENHFGDALMSNLEEQTVELFKQSIVDGLESTLEESVKPIIQNALNDIRKRHENNQTIS